MGTGFVVGPNEVMTAAHVAYKAPTITVSSNNGQLTKARLIALDFETDSALLRTEQSFDEARLTISSRPLALGRELAVLGYPLWVNDLQVSTGVISGLDEPVSYDNPVIFTVDHVFITDAATNGGNSGGPVFDRSGQVVGLVSGSAVWSGAGKSLRPVQGRNYIVPANSLIANLRSWSGREPEAVELCNGEIETPNDAHLKITVASDHPDALAVTQALFLHGESINNRDYEAAWSVFSPRYQRNHSLKSWAPGHETSYWETLEIQEVTGTADRLTVRTRFRTTQAAEYGPNGQTCSDWDITYGMVRVDGVWRIDSTQGSTPSAC